MSETSTTSNETFGDLDMSVKKLSNCTFPVRYSESVHGKCVNDNGAVTPLTLAVVIPAYKVSASLAKVILSLPEIIHHIIVVDDCCPDNSGDIAKQLGNPRVSVIRHTRNKGVGGAMVTGYRKALELNCDIIVKIDGDGQMNHKYIYEMIKPIMEKRANYVKGNRFYDFGALKAMPIIRLLGNNILSFWVKSASGYWSIMDPTNGYTAIDKEMLMSLPLDKIAKRYFFESDMLIHLNIHNAAVEDVPIPARYGQEKSSLSIVNVLLQFPLLLLIGFVKRMLLRYFIYDFNMASVYIACGVPMFIGAAAFGIYEWIDSCVNNSAKTAGTIMLIALPLIISFNMLLQAIHIDISNCPHHREK
jgi:dolichol-phosphate mannosyltransferase